MELMESRISTRWKVALAAFGLAATLKRLRREERTALEGAGRSFRARAEGAGAHGEGVSAALARVAALEEHERALAQRLALSLEADRNDYRATETGVGRSLIVLRGVLDRLVVRDEAWRARRELPARLVELGAAVLADAAAAAALPEEERARAQAAEKALRDATGEREALLAPYGGEALPRGARALVAELGTFLGFVREELSKKLILRLPALAAMGVAWWVTHRFTVSRRERWMNELLGRERGLSEGAVDWLTFWLPLLAAALVAYLLFTVRRRIRRRYLGGEGGDDGRRAR
jgi:hypothetical protein